MESEHENLSTHSQNEDACITGAESTAAEASVGQLKLSAMSTLQESPHRSFEVPVSPSVVSALKRCRETATNLALASKIRQRPAVGDLESISSTSGRKFSDQANDKDNITLAAQNGRTLWLLMYIALVTTCPLINSAIYTRWRGKFMNLKKGPLK